MLERQHLARSVDLFQIGQSILPAGSSSPLRTFSEVRTPPVFIRSAQGSILVDVDGNRYVDFACGLGPMILGHAAEAVVAAVAEQMRQGSVHGMPSEIEYQLARIILDSVPCIERLRFVCSGTEAVMSAVRVALRVTGKSKVLKFRGCYHGHSDLMLGSPDRADSHCGSGGDGILARTYRSVILCDFNDTEKVRRLFAEAGHQIAAAIVEPFPCNMGLVKPRNEFLSELRRCCDDAGALLIFDEVVNGYRFLFGSVSSLLGTRPDLITFGKIIGGGLPIGAFGGKLEHMRVLGESSEVFPGGTFAGNPLSMAAGVAALRELSREGFYERLERLGALMENILSEGLHRAGMPYTVVRQGSVFWIALTDDGMPLETPGDETRLNRDLFSEFHWEMARRGFLLAPSLEEPMFLSSAHTEADIESFAVNAIEALRTAGRER